MNELNVHLRSISRFVLFFLSLSLLCWALFPTGRPLASGLALGGAAAWINAGFLYLRVRTITEEAARPTGRRLSLGFLTRVAVVAFAVFIGLKVPNINLYMIVVGYLVIQLATLLLGYIGIRRGKG